MDLLDIPRGIHYITSDGTHTAARSTRGDTMTAQEVTQETLDRDAQELACIMERLNNLTGRTAADTTTIKNAWWHVKMAHLLLQGAQTAAPPDGWDGFSFELAQD